MDGSASQERRAENNRHVAVFCITPESCSRSVQCALAVVVLLCRENLKTVEEEQQARRIMFLI